MGRRSIPLSHFVDGEASGSGDATNFSSGEKDVGGMGGGFDFWAWPVLPTLGDARVLLIREALRRAKGNQAVAARMLGVTPQALSKHLHAERKK